MQPQTKVIRKNANDPLDPILRISILSNTSRMCYHQIRYEIISSVYLTSDALDALRAANLFMRGQHEGTLCLAPTSKEDYAFRIEKLTPDGKVDYWQNFYRYELESICDSSD